MWHPTTSLHYTTYPSVPAEIKTVHPIYPWNLCLLMSNSTKYRTNSNVYSSVKAWQNLICDLAPMPDQPLWPFKTGAAELYHVTSRHVHRLGPRPLRVDPLKPYTGIPNVREALPLFPVTTYRLLPRQPTLTPCHPCSPQSSSHHHLLLPRRSALVRDSVVSEKCRIDFTLYC